MLKGTITFHSAELAAFYNRTCDSSSISFELAEMTTSQMANDAADIADSIKNDAQLSGQVPTAVLLLSDSKYELRFAEMIKTWSKFAGKDNLVMVALDDATDRHFQQQGIKTVRVMPEDAKPENTVREAVLQTKVVVPCVFLLKGVRVVMVEMDIYCRANPLIIDNGTADIVVAEHNYCEEVNVGFWIAYPTCPVIDSFRRMQAWVANPNRQGAYCDGAFDQKLMHYAWLGHGALSEGSHSSCRNFTERDKIFDARVDRPVNLERVSYEDLMHWPLSGHNLETWPSNSSDPKCVHIWSGFGPPREQILYGYRRGWFPPDADREAKNALGQLTRSDE